MREDTERHSNQPNLKYNDLVSCVLDIAHELLDIDRDIIIQGKEIGENQSEKPGKDNFIKQLITNYQRGRQRKRIKKIRKNDKWRENSDNEISKGSRISHRPVNYQQGQQKFNGSIRRNRFIKK